MKQRSSGAALVLCVVAIVLTASLSVSCGGGGGDSGPTPIPIATDPSGTPVTFEAFRAELVARLDAIGANIGAVPDDVKQQLLLECSQLSNFVDRDDVEPLCNAIDQAVQRNDPGLINNVVRSIGELEGD